MLAGEKASISKRFSLVAAAALAVCALAASSAQAAPITLGSSLPAGAGASKWAADLSFVQTSLPGAVLTAPVDGVITNWRVRNPKGKMALTVLDVSPGPTYTLREQSATENTPVLEAGVKTFPTNLPIKAGQTIGLDVTSPAEFAYVASSAIFGYVEPPLEPGVPTPLSTTQEQELPFNATMQPAPTITAVTPSSASITSAPLTLEGSDFVGVTGVEFGGFSATGFKVESENKITFASPGSVEPKTVNVSVTTIAGKSAPVKFTYTACTVPGLRGKSVKAAKKLLKKKKCKLGRVKRAPGAGSGAKVKKQNRKAGIYLPVGKKVDVKVG